MFCLVVKDVAVKTGTSTYSSSIEDAINYTAWILRQFAPYFGEKVLEVGLGHGAYRRFLPKASAYLGIDIDPEVIAAARARMPGDAFIQADIADPRIVDQLAFQGIDTVLCVNVLEHVKQHQEALEHLLALLPSSGHLLLYVPAHRKLFTHMDHLAGHHRRYSRQDMENLVPKAGRLIVNDYVNPIGGLGWWFNGWFQHRSLNSDAVNHQIMLFDRFVLPISALMTPMTRSFFGQSLLSVIKKQ